MYMIIVQHTSGPVLYSDLRSKSEVVGVGTYTRTLEPCLPTKPGAHLVRKLLFLLRIPHYAVRLDSHSFCAHHL